MKNLFTTSKRKLRNKNHSRGFSLIEVVIGISVITLVITAAAEVTRTSIKMGSITSNELIAHHLAEEGIEIVRNVRDSNWMRNEEWKKTLEAGTYVIKDAVQDGISAARPPWELQKKEAAVAIEGERFHREVTLSFTPVTVRTLITSDDGAVAPTEETPEEIMTVISKISYDERGKVKIISLSTQLTDWKQGPI